MLTDFKEGELLVCNHQPSIMYPINLTTEVKQKYKLKGEYCIFVKDVCQITCEVLFPKYGYKHVFVKTSLQRV